MSLLMRIASVIAATLLATPAAADNKKVCLVARHFLEPTRAKTCTQRFFQSVLTKWTEFGWGQVDGKGMVFFERSRLVVSRMDRNAAAARTKEQDKTTNDGW